MRGWLNGVERCFNSSGPLLGDVEAGAVAAVLGVPLSIERAGVRSRARSPFPGSPTGMPALLWCS